MADKKDAWDKVDVVGNLMSSVLLAAIAILVARGSEKIANSMRSGEIVASLVEHLSMPDSGTRHEIALAALNRAVWDQNRELVWDVCERIIRNGKFVDYTRSYAFQLLLERDSTRATALLADIGHQELVVRGPVEGAMLARPPLDSLASALRARYASGGVVYVQFAGEENRQIAEALRQRLAAQGFRAPAVEPVDPQVNRVYYFHKQDSVLADSLARTVQAFFLSQDPSRTLPGFTVRNLAGRYRVPQGQLEVWVSPVP